MTSYLMPARSGDNGDASLDSHLIQVAHEVLADGPRRDLKAASGENGTKCGAITMKIFVRDRMLVNLAIVIAPP